MSWNILPKNVLQYFLEKIKSKFMLILNHDILGAKNILPFPYAYGTGTHHGLTITVNDDGSITAQGVPTQALTFLISNNIIEDLALWQGSEMIFSEWEVENQNAFAALLLGQSTPISEVRGDYKLTVTSEMIQQGVAFILYFADGVDLTTPITFKPMVRLATDPDHTWRSPSLTNKQLTDRVFYLNYAKSHVSANPSTTTGTLTGIEIDGTGYTFPGSSSVTGVKGSNESNYRTGDVNISANNVGALGVVGNVTVSSLDDLVALCLNSGNNKAFEGPINISTDIGVGITGWCNTIGACLNAPNNGSSNIGLFCLFMSTNTSVSPRYAIIDGKTTGNYSVTATGVFTRDADLSTKVSKSGDTMSGPLFINATNAAGNYDEGIRINAGKNGFSSLLIGGSENSTSGTSDGQFWIGTNRDNASYKRKLYIAHAGSTASGTYFESDSASRVGPALHLGWSGSVGDGNPYAVNGDVVYDYITSHMLNARPDVSGNMNDVAGFGNSMGMINLSGTDGNINPGGKTGWHHFINISYSQTSGSNMWQTQLACQAGTTNLYIRSRSGGSVTSAAWAAPWVRLAKTTDLPSNDAVTQTGTLAISSNNKWFRMLYSATADDTTRTEGARKGIISFNPVARAIAFANTNSYLLSCQTNKSLIMYNDGDGDHGLCHRAVNGDGNQWGLMPYRDGWLSLGHGSYRWGQIYSTSGSISTSDRNEKKDISPLDDKARDFIMALNPVSYKFIDGKTGRTHYGMISQDVEEEMLSLGMTDMDFAGFCKDQKMEEHYIENEDGTKTPDFKYIDEYRYGLRYEEFISPIIKTEQLQQEDINSLKEEISLLKEEIALLKQRLQILEDK